MEEASREAPWTSPVDDHEWRVRVDDEDVVSEEEVAKAAEVATGSDTATQLYHDKDVAVEVSEEEVAKRAEVAIGSDSATQLYHDDCATLDGITFSLDATAHFLGATFVQPIGSDVATQLFPETSPTTAQHSGENPQEKHQRRTGSHSDETVAYLELELEAARDRATALDARGAVLVAALAAAGPQSAPTSTPTGVRDDIDPDRIEIQRRPRQECEFGADPVTGLYPEETLWQNGNP
jgi:hypothetical protein